MSPVEILGDDRRGTICNDRGRVIREGCDLPLPGVYAAGWIKRGPSGVIGTNKKCALETVSLILEDLAAGVRPTRTGTPEQLLDKLAGRQAIVDYAGWERIDAHERQRGVAEGPPRVKVVHRSEHLARAKGRC